MGYSIDALYKDRRDKDRVSLAKGQKQAASGTERKTVGRTSTTGQVSGDILEKMKRLGLNDQAVAKLQSIYLPEASDARKVTVERMITAPPSWQELAHAHDTLVSSRR